MRLTDNQMRVLVLLYDKQESGLPSPSCAAIAAELGAAVGGMNQTTGSLVRRGYLARERRRGHVLFLLTAAGEAVAEPAWRATEGEGS